MDRKEGRLSCADSDTDADSDADTGKSNIKFSKKDEISLFTSRKNPE